MHNFELTDEQSMILESVRKLVEDVASPSALHRDEHRSFVRESFDGLAELGLFGMLVGEDSGGAGLGWLSLVVAVEECAKACGSTARMLLTQGGAVASALDGLASGEHLLEGVMVGEKVCAWIGPENEVAVSGGAVSGAARLVTGAGEAAALLVAAVDGDEAVLCSVDADSIEAVPALGFRATAPGRVRFDGVAATELARGAAAEAAIGRAGLALWIGGAALAVGTAEGAINHAERHAAERVAFGKPLARQQAVKRKLVESRLRTESARHLCFHAARLADAGEDAGGAARLAKIAAIDAAVHASDEAIQIHGGYGFTVEYHVERHYRDAKTLEVLDGGTDALRDALAL